MLRNKTACTTTAKTFDELFRLGTDILQQIALCFVECPKCSVGDLVASRQTCKLWKVTIDTTSQISKCMLDSFANCSVNTGYFGYLKSRSQLRSNILQAHNDTTLKPMLYSKLKILYLRNFPYITNKSLENIGLYCPNLIEFGFDRSNASLRLSLKYGTMLNLSSTGMNYIFKNCLKLKKIKLIHCLQNCQNLFNIFQQFDNGNILKINDIQSINVYKATGKNLISDHEITNYKCDSALKNKNMESQISKKENDGVLCSNNVEYLSLEGNGVIDNHCVKLISKYFVNLTYLNLKDAIADDIECLKHCKKIENLQLQHAWIKADSIVGCIKQGCKDCIQVLNVGGNETCMLSHAVEILKMCPKLEKFGVVTGTQVHQHSLETRLTQQLSELLVAFFWGIDQSSPWKLLLVVRGRNLNCIN